MPLAGCVGQLGRPLSSWSGGPCLFFFPFFPLPLRTNTSSSPRLHLHPALGVTPDHTV
ncbi:hypothetical protein CORC01_13831 [Colletotrichum orchidophilum]|uniref:Uncharacterized protein n=1 Tax=Colletotrichum orchidophilum TaxID=1209926 RepID=A0A1G4AP59_9PEZI|nr:uncharacterized protein CORC01_13831 [Colletotrichum orchidophilum]OHE90886.1 hypothetical protein CORC01_13831 [Colletotrichum orchidophilum]